MGEIADDIIAGRCCALCGCYFIEPENPEKYEWEDGTTVKMYEHGFPVACADCWEEDCGYNKTTALTL